MLGVIEIIALVLELVTILFCIENLFGKRFEKNIYLLVLMIAYLLIFIGINIYDFPTYLSVLAYISIIIYCIFFYKKNITVTLVNFFLAFAIIGVFQLLYYVPVFYILRDSPYFLKIGGIFINIASAGSLYVLCGKVKLKLASDFICQKSWIIKTLFAFVILYFFLNIFYMQMNSSLKNDDFVQIILFTALFFLAINEWQKAIEDAERKKTQLEMNKLYYDAYDELILLIRERQHDMKNHINAILGMIYTIDNYKDLVESQKKYCDDIVEKNKETKLLLAISNPLIAGFLYRKFQEAQKQKILVECKVASKDDNHIIPEYELIEMLGILLDNAIEALNEKDETERNIFVDIEDREENLQIMVANKSRYYDPDEICRFFQKDYSSKGKGHGIGLTKLKRIVQEKDGDIMVTNETRNESNYLQFCLIFPKKK